MSIGCAGPGIPGNSNISLISVADLGHPSESSLHMSPVQEEPHEQDDFDELLSSHGVQVEVLHSAPPSYHEAVGIGLVGVDIPSQPAVWIGSSNSQLLSDHQLSSSPPGSYMSRGPQRSLSTPPWQSPPVPVDVLSVSSGGSVSPPAQTECFSLISERPYGEFILLRFLEKRANIGHSCLYDPDAKYYRGSLSSSSENTHYSYETSQIFPSRSGNDSYVQLLLY